MIVGWRIAPASPYRRKLMMPVITAAATMMTSPRMDMLMEFMAVSIFCLSPVAVI